MFAYIKGILTRTSPGYAIIETAGIGYKIHIPANAFVHLPACGSDVCLQISQVIRDVSHTLYGFLNEEERDFFEVALGVAGIGPKTALSLIGHLSLGEMQHAIANHDISALSRVPGIGKKTAERLVVELRDKLSKGATSHSPGEFAIHVGTDPRARYIGDAMNALINLGYNQATAEKALKKSLKALPESSDLAALITDALNHV